MKKRLILSVKSGSEKAYRTLYEMWVSRLYQFVYQYLKSEETTDDVVQETFYRIWINREKLDAESSFKAYLFTIASGTEKAYQTLYEMWVSRLYQFVYQYLKSEETTDDVVQETFYRIWINRKKLDAESSFKAYLFTIAYHLLLKELRRQLNNTSMEEFIEYNDNIRTSGDEAEKQIDFDQFCKALKQAKEKLTPRQRENTSMEEFIEYNDNIRTSGDEAEKQIDFDQFCKALKQAKEKLTPRQREIFELNKEQNLSVAEIAEQLCIKEQVVRNQLSTALKIIRTELQQYSFILLLFLSHF